MIRNEYKPLPSQPVDAAGCYVPESHNPPSVRADSPAVLVMTDLTRLPAATISGTCPLPDANTSMIHRSVRMLFVVDGEGRLQGIVTASDVLGERPVLTALSKGVRRDELRVADIMTPLAAIQAIPMDIVRRSEVGHVVATLKESGRQHAIVVDTTQGKQVISGVFSVTQIARQLGAPITTSEVARNFAEIEAVIAGV